MSELFPYPIGFSDHYISTLSSAFAVIAGAKIIEKHLTFNRKEKVGDYFVSLEPVEFGEMVTNIKIAEKMLGHGRRVVFESEKKWRQNARKSLAASKDLEKGTILKKEDIFLKRPGGGFPGDFLEFLIGKKLAKSINKGEFIRFEHIADE